MTVFDEIPESVVVSDTAASYTIPTGYYGIAKCQVDRGGTISINGTVALSSYSDTWNAIASNNSPQVGINGSSQGGSIPVSTGTITSAAAMYSNSTAKSQNSAEQSFKLPAGTVLVGSGNARYCIELYLM